MKSCCFHLFIHEKSQSSHKNTPKQNKNCKQSWKKNCCHPRLLQINVPLSLIYFSKYILSLFGCVVQNLTGLFILFLHLCFCKLFKTGFFWHFFFFFHFQSSAQLPSNPYLLLSLSLTALLSCPGSHSHYEQANSWHNVSSCCESPTTSLLDQAYCLVHHWV